MVRSAEIHHHRRSKCWRRCFLYVACEYCLRATVLLLCAGSGAQFQHGVDLQGIDMLPVLLVPGDEQIQKVCAHFYSAHKRIVLHYQHILLFKSNSPQAFVYHFTFLLLAYTCLKMLLDSTRKGDSEHQHKLFVPIVLLHMLQKVEESNSST